MIVGEFPAPAPIRPLRYAEAVSTVLVVSDVAVLRRDLAATIADDDIDVEEAPSGPLAIERVKRGDVDLVLTDMQVGSMGGVAITMELRNLESYGEIDSIPVLVLVDRRADVFLARRCGADGFVVKPLDGYRLRAAVAALLRGESYEDTSLRPATVRAGTAG